MRIHNLSTDADGESHFRDIEVESVERRRGSKLSKRLPATGVIFRETQAEHNLDWHPAPRRPYIVNLDAGVKITARHGESRVIAERSFWGTDITRMPCSYRQCVTMFTEELPWLKGRDLERVMGGAVVDWLGWKRPAAA